MECGFNSYAHFAAAPETLNIGAALGGLAAVLCFAALLVGVILRARAKAANSHNTPEAAPARPHPQKKDTFYTSCTGVHTPILREGIQAPKEIPAIDFGDILWYNYLVKNA